MDIVLDALGLALVGGGLLLATIGLYGMLRKPDILHQLHAAGLISGPAVILVLLGSIATGNAEIITSAALIILFVLITSPLSGHAIAQTAYRRRGSGAPEIAAEDAPDERQADPPDPRPTGR